MPVEQVWCVGQSDASPDVVWSIAGAFCEGWHPAVATMEAERGADGALVRAFTVQGEETVYRERLCYRSDSDRELAYRHLQGIAGVDDYAARLSVTADGQGGSVITMSATLTAPMPRAAQIAAGTTAIFEAGIAALAAQAETGGRADMAPVVGPDPVPVVTEFIDGAPRLAVSVTPDRPGPLCLFLHGIGGHRSNWDAQLPVAAGHMRAAALDLRGYGDSALGPEQSCVDDYCADILRIRAAFGNRKLVLCGLSYGAWIATSFAMRHPDMLAGLVLAGGCTGMSEAEPETRAAFRDSRTAPMDAGQTPADFAPDVVQVIAGPQASDAVRDTLRRSMAMIPVATYRDAVTCFTSPGERFDFARLTMPVLVMTGEHDRLAPPGEIRSVAQRICDSEPQSDVRFEELAGAGHVCNLEAPEMFNRTLSDFLARIVP